MHSNDALFVEWFYRAEIKSPPDTISELAKEAGCSAAEVREGIAEAKRLLDQVQPMLDAGLLTLDGKVVQPTDRKGRKPS